MSLKFTLCGCKELGTKCFGVRIGRATFSFFSSRAGAVRETVKQPKRRTTSQEETESFAAWLQKLAAFVRRAVSGPHLAWIRET